MIAVKLKGGIGNQMFQYAVARSLAIEKNTWVYLDPSFLYEDAKGRWTQRDYALGPFHIQYKFEKSGRINFLRRLNHSSTWRRWSETAWWPFSFRNFNEAGTQFQPELFSLPRNVYLEGYFQSEKYFIKHAELIRKDFTVIEPPTGRNAEVMEQIRSCCAVSVHVRRGDYLALTSANSFHGTLQPHYYSAAINELGQRVSEPKKWFVFSDDIEWAKANLLKGEQATFIDWNQGETSFEDIRLMSSCKHHIIANSSFSWWGAWLNPSPEKNVIAPARWFAQMNTDDRDIVPETWIRINERPSA